MSLMISKVMLETGTVIKAGDEYYLSNINWCCKQTERALRCHDDELLNSRPLVESWVAPSLPYNADDIIRSDHHRDNNNSILGMTEFVQECSFTLDPCIR